MTKREVARFEPLQITKHLRFRLVSVENGMSEKLGSANSEFRNAQGNVAALVVRKSAHMRAAKDRHQRFDIALGCCFVERNADCSIAQRAQIASGLVCVREQGGARFNFDADRVEKLFVSNF